MILNLLMFFGAFMAAKRPAGRALAAVIIGVVKGAAYYAETHDPYFSAFVGAIFFSMIFGIIACLMHLDKKEDAGIPVYPKYGSRITKPLDWAYVLLSILVFSTIFGESVLIFFLA